MSRLLSGFGFSGSSREWIAGREGVDWGAAADAELAGAAQANPGARAGREAFVEIVRRHQTAVCAVAWSVTGRVGLTDDIAQETFFKAWKQIGTLRDPARLKPWLTKIAHDCAVDALRRERRQLPGWSGFSGVRSALGFGSGSCSHADSGPDWGSDFGFIPGFGNADAAPSPDAPPDKAAADAEEEALVWSALAALPETWRTPLVLFYREGKSVAAVAASLGLSEDAVKQRLSRGRQALRSAVESRIETVLSRVQPSALLVVTVAAGLGLFSKSTALAAGIGSGAITAGSVGSAAISSTTGSVAAGAGGAGGSAGVFGFMTATSWLAAALSLAAFLPLGWRAHGPAAGDGSAGKAAAVVAVSGLDSDDPFAAYPDSQLLATWRRLHAEHGSDAAAMPVIHALIEAEPDAFRRRALGIALLAEWAAVDPEGGFQKLWSEAKNTEQSAQFLREWLKRDPGAAAARLITSLPGAETLAAAVCKDVAELSPENFIAVLKTLPVVPLPEPGYPSARLDPPVLAALEVFVRKDLQGAVAALPLLKGYVLQNLQLAIASTMARQDPAGALEWTRSLADAAERQKAGVAAIKVWAAANPSAALAGLDPVRDDQMMADAVLEGVAEKDPAAAIRLKSEQSGRFNEDSWGVIIGPFNLKFQTNPMETVDFLNTLPGDIQEKMVQHLGWSVTGTESLRKARDWALSQKPEGLAGLLGNKILGGEIYSNHAESGRLMKALSPEWQESIYRNAGEFSGALNEQEIEDLLTTAPSQAARASLLKVAFGKAGDNSIPDFKLWTGRLEELPPEARGGAAGELASRLVFTDPQAAVAFADSIPEGEARHAAYYELIKSWTFQDMHDASAWVDGLPQGAGRDVAIAGMLDRLTRSDPDAALTWAAAIGNPEMRLRHLTDVMKTTAKETPAKVPDLMGNTALTVHDREVLGLAVSNPPSKP